MKLKIILILNILMTKNGWVNKRLKCKKRLNKKNIPLNLNGENIDLFAFALSRMFSFYIDKTSFPNILKQTRHKNIDKKR